MEIINQNVKSQNQTGLYTVVVDLSSMEYIRIDKSFITQTQQCTTLYPPPLCDVMYIVKKEGGHREFYT